VREIGRHCIPKGASRFLPAIPPPEVRRRCDAEAACQTNATAEDAIRSPSEAISGVLNSLRHVNSSLDEDALSPLFFPTLGARDVISADACIERTLTEARSEAARADEVADSTIRTIEGWTDQTQPCVPTTELIQVARPALLRDFDSLRSAIGIGQLPDLPGLRSPKVTSVGPLAEFPDAEVRKGIAMASEEKRKRDAELSGLIREVTAPQNEANGRRKRNDHVENQQKAVFRDVAERVERKKSRIAATHAAEREKPKSACERALQAAGLGDSEQAAADNETEYCITIRH
jgi:hypothetical protein